MLTPGTESARDRAESQAPPMAGTSCPLWRCRHSGVGTAGPAQVHTAHRGEICTLPLPSPAVTAGHCVHTVSSAQPEFLPQQVTVGPPLQLTVCGLVPISPLVSALLLDDSGRPEPTRAPVQGLLCHAAPTGDQGRRPWLGVCGAEPPQAWPRQVSSGLSATCPHTASPQVASSQLCSALRSTTPGPWPWPSWSSQWCRGSTSAHTAPTCHPRCGPCSAGSARSTPCGP